MFTVALESPYADDISTNVKYARECMVESISRGEAPLPSHLLYTQDGVLDDDDPMSRTVGISAGFAWNKKADYAVFYCDLGWSDGMKSALKNFMALGKPIVVRYMKEQPGSYSFHPGQDEYLNVLPHIPQMYRITINGKPAWADPEQINNINEQYDINNLN